MVPDGGLKAWSVVAASFMILNFDGIVFSFGILLPTIAQQFNAGREEAALTHAIMNFTGYGFAPVAAVLITRFGHMAVTQAGVMIAVAGYLAAGVSAEAACPIYVLHFTAGFMAGFGLSLMYLAANDIICKYFDKNLGLASGIALSGGATGALVSSEVLYQLNANMGLGPTLLLLGVITSTGVFFTAFFDSPPSNEDPNLNVEKETICTGLKVYCSIFKDSKIILFLLAHLLVSIASMTGYIYAADYAQHINIEGKFIPILISTTGIFNCLGRIIFGALLDKFREKAFMLTTTVFFIHAGVLGASTYMPGLTGQLVFAALFGLSFGCSSCSRMVLIKMICEDSLRETYGLLLFFNGLTALLSPEIVGRIIDATGSYRLGFLVAGALGLGGALLLPLISYLNTRGRVKPMHGIKS